MKTKELILILFIFIFIFILIVLFLSRNCEQFDQTNNIESIPNIRSTIHVPNFYDVFGYKTLTKMFEFPGEYNWKLFTNTDLVPNEGLPSLLCSDNPLFYNINSNMIIRLVGFKKPSAIIGIMTPTNIPSSGQWLKSFDWYGVSNVGKEKNAKKVVIWANHKNNIEIKLNKDNIIEDAVKVFEFEVPFEASLTGPIRFNIDNYKLYNHSPFTTYYFQIVDNWGDPNTVKVGCIIPYYEI